MEDWPRGWMIGPLAISIALAATSYQYGLGVTAALAVVLLFVALLLAS